MDLALVIMVIAIILKTLKVNIMSSVKSFVLSGSSDIRILIRIYGIAYYPNP